MDRLDNLKLNGRTRVPFAAVPNKFLQDPSISADAKGTASFLQSLPDNFSIHPTYVQKIMGFKRKPWDRISKELIDYGCLKYHKGGLDGGSYYTFDFWHEECRVYQKGTTAATSRDVLKGTVPKSDCPKKVQHNKKQEQEKETVSEKTTNNTDAVVALRKELSDILIIGDTADKILTGYTIEQIETAFKYLRHPKTVIKSTASGLFLAAIKGGWAVPKVVDMKAKTSEDREAEATREKSEREEFYKRQDEEMYARDRILHPQNYTADGKLKAGALVGYPMPQSKAQG